MSLAGWSSSGVFFDAFCVVSARRFIQQIVWNYFGDSADWAAVLPLGRMQWSRSPTGAVVIFATILMLFLIIQGLK